LLERPYIHFHIHKNCYANLQNVKNHFVVFIKCLYIYISLHSLSCMYLFIC
jgi:hypothetical protein